MKNLSLIGFVFAGLFFWGPAKCLAAQSNEASSIPDFQEVHRLVLDNLKGISDQELNRAAVLGFLNQLYPKVSLVTNALEQAEASGDSLIANERTFDEFYGYLRIFAIQSGLSEQVSTAIKELESGKKLKGLILDLRFANGRDYAAATEVADLFLDSERMLLKWGDSEARSTSKTNAIVLPVAVLVNRQTSEAAEALAAVLRDTHRSLTIGAPTAGEARVYAEFDLRNGQRLRVASDNVELGDGEPFPDKGLIPDLLVEVKENQERAFLADPYSRSGPQLADRAPENKEAEKMRPGASESRIEPPPFHESTLPQLGKSTSLVKDPVLARAIDFLKGWALLRRGR